MQFIVCEVDERVNWKKAQPKNGGRYMGPVNKAARQAFQSILKGIVDEEIQDVRFSLRDMEDKSNITYFLGTKKRLEQPRIIKRGDTEYVVTYEKEIYTSNENWGKLAKL